MSEGEGKRWLNMARVRIAPMLDAETLEARARDDDATQRTPLPLARKWARHGVTTAVRWSTLAALGGLAGVRIGQTSPPPIIIQLPAQGSK